MTAQYLAKDSKSLANTSENVTTSKYKAFVYTHSLKCQLDYTVKLQLQIQIWESTTCGEANALPTTLSECCFGYGRYNLSAEFPAVLSSDVLAHPSRRVVYSCL